MGRPVRARGRDPLTRDVITARMIATAMLAVAGLALVLFAIARAAGWLLDHQRLTAWEAAWTSIEPQWTRRPQ